MLQGLQLPGQGVGARRLPVPHLCSPLNISVGVAPPITNPVFAYSGVSRAPQKHLPVPWWGEALGLGAQPSPPPPAGKQHLGFQCDSCVLNPIFQMDGGRRAGQVTCLKVMRGQGGEGLAALRGGLCPVHSKMGTQNPVPGHKGCPVGSPPPSPSRQTAVLASQGECMHGMLPHSRSLLPGMAQVGTCPARQQFSKHVGAQVGALRGTEMEQKIKLFPDITSLLPGGPLCSLSLIASSSVLSIRCWQLPRGRHHLPATTSSYLCAPPELPPHTTELNQQL